MSFHHQPLRSFTLPPIDRRDAADEEDASLINRRGSRVASRSQSFHSNGDESEGGRSKQGIGQFAGLSNKNFQEDITLDDLIRLKKVFDDMAQCADAEEAGQLNLKQFITAFAPILGATMSKSQLEDLFMKIDASGNGSVDWDEFTGFLLHSGHKAVNSDADSVSFVKDARVPITLPTECSATSVSGYNHAEVVTRVVSHPRANKIYTGSQDGTVRVWDATTLEFESVMHNNTAWVTDVCLARGDSKICVSTVDRLISVYDAHSERLLKAFVGNTSALAKYTMMRGRPLTKMEIDMRHVSSVKSRAAEASETLEMFRQRQDRVRTTQGPPPMVDVHILKQMDFPAMCMMNTRVLPEKLFVGLSNGVVQCYNMLRAPIPDLIAADMNITLHRAAVTTMQWQGSSSYFFTTGVDGCITLVNAEKEKHTVLHEGTLNKRRRESPIHSAVYLEAAKLLATCGGDHVVNLWSPSAQMPPIALKGHLNTVSHVAYSDDEELLISLDCEKCIKVWDLRTLRCVQSSVDYDTYTPTDKLTSMCYDDKRRCLVTACCAPVVWTLSKVLTMYPDSTYHGHQKPIVAVVYNPVFRQLATADAEVVKLWNVETGVLLSVVTVDSLRATMVRTILSDDGVSYIVSVCFDSTYRRIIIGLSTGTVLIANFANGQLLTEMLPLRPSAVKRETTSHEATAMTYHGTDTTKCVIVLRGFDLLIWEDSAGSSFDRRLDTSFRVHVEYSAFLRLRWTSSSSEEEVVGAHQWRTPLPTCIASFGLTALAIGTDSGLLLVYGLAGHELVAVLGEYEPSANVLCIAVNDRRGLICGGRSDGKIQIHSPQYKDRCAYIFLRTEPLAAVPQLQAIAVDASGSCVVAADDDGYVYVCSIANFDISALPAFGVALARVSEPMCGLQVSVYFRAHNAEVQRLAFIDGLRGHQCICTGGSEAQVRLFTMEGKFVGYCGNEKDWDLAVSKPSEAMLRIPAPVLHRTTSPENRLSTPSPSAHRGVSAAKAKILTDSGISPTAAALTAPTSELGGHLPPLDATPRRAHPPASKPQQAPGITEIVSDSGSMLLNPPLESSPSRVIAAPSTRSLRVASTDVQKKDTAVSFGLEEQHASRHLHPSPALDHTAATGPTRVRLHPPRSLASIVARPPQPAVGTVISPSTSTMERFSEEDLVNDRVSQFDAINVPFAASPGKVKTTHDNNNGATNSAALTANAAALTLRTALPPLDISKLRSPAVVFAPSSANWTTTTSTVSARTSDELRNATLSMYAQKNSGRAPSEATAQSARPPAGKLNALGSPTAAAAELGKKKVPTYEEITKTASDIETRLEMWRSHKTSHGEDSAWAARACLRLLPKPPDLETIREVSSRRHVTRQGVMLNYRGRGTEIRQNNGANNEPSVTAKGVR